MALCFVIFTKRCLTGISQKVVTQLKGVLPTYCEVRTPWRGAVWDTHLTKYGVFIYLLIFIRKLIKLIKNKSWNMLEQSCLMWHRLWDLILLKKPFNFSFWTSIFLSGGCHPLAMTENRTLFHFAILTSIFVITVREGSANCGCSYLVSSRHHCVQLLSGTVDSSLCSKVFPLT